MTYFPKKAGPNLIHNGAMQVHQRGTSTAGITDGGYFTADRWNGGASGLGTWTQSIENDAPSGSGLSKSLKMLCTTATTSLPSTQAAGISQAVEGQNMQMLAKGTASARPMVLTFWVKSNVTGTYVAEPYDLTNDRQCSFQYTISSSATWEKKTIVIPADTAGAFVNTNAAAFQVQFWLGAGATYTSGTLQPTWVAVTNANRAVGQTNLAAAEGNYWQVTGVQLEVGATASAFQFKPYGQELIECQRYYQVGRAAGTTSINSDNGVCSASFSVEMRANPNVSVSLLEAIPGWGNIASYVATEGKDASGFVLVKPVTAYALPAAFHLTYAASADI